MVAIPVLPHVPGTCAIRIDLPYVMRVPRKQLILVEGTPVGADEAVSYAVVHIDDLLIVVVGEYIENDRQDVCESEFIRIILPAPEIAEWVAGAEYWEMVERLLGRDACARYLAGASNLEFSDSEILLLTQTVYRSVRL